MQIRQIIDKINDNQMFVPAFQREYVWKRADAKALFSSLIKEYPTGTLLTWETTNPPELKGPIKYNTDMGAVKLILDGQQRITTIYMITEGRLPPYYNQSEIKHDITGLYVNLETLELEYFKRQQMQNNPLWINLTDIFQNKIRSSDVRRDLREQSLLTDELEDLIDNNFHSIYSVRDRDFPEQIIPVRANIKEAIDIFYIVNTGGVNLTDAELALAQICGYWPEARDLFKVKLKELEARGFVFKLDFIIYCLLAVIYWNGSEMRRLHGIENKEQIQEAWGILDKQVLDYVCNILQSHAFVDHTDEINSVFAIIPIIAFVFQKPDRRLNEDEINRVVKWFFYAQLRQRYVSQTPQKLDRDLAKVRDEDRPFESLLGVIAQERSLEITPEEFVGRDVRHPLFSLMRWYFKSRQAVCLGSGVAIRQNMGSRYALEKDHIFPYAALKKNGYAVTNRFKYALAQELTNRAILSQIENRTKSDTSASEYLSAAKARSPSALRKQCIPEDASLWEMTSFEAFLEARRRLLAKELNAFLDGLTDMEAEYGQISVVDLIEEDEHAELEYKSSLRWDVDEGRVNKDLEKVVMKTIAAFNNGYGDGGTLLIGVSDDREVLGLEDDLSTLRGEDLDAFELHLRELVRREFDDAYNASQVSIKFEEVDQKTVCVVRVEKGHRPLFVKTQDRHGQVREQFFVRAGNSSRLIEEPSKVTGYISERFRS